MKGTSYHHNLGYQGPENQVARLSKNCFVLCRHELSHNGICQVPTVGTDSGWEKNRQDIKQLTFHLLDDMVDKNVSRRLYVTMNALNSCFVLRVPVIRSVQ